MYFSYETKTGYDEGPKNGDVGGQEDGVVDEGRTGV